MKKIYYSWKLYEAVEATEQRHCHNCGKKVTFTDSGLKRVNANGKDLFEFAIYKCDNGHTWNKLLGSYKSKEVKDQFVNVKVEPTSKIDFINTGLCKKDGIEDIIIFIEEVYGKWRLDKLLAQQIEDLSRTQIEKLINSDKISVNNESVKSKMLVKNGYTIKILL